MCLGIKKNRTEKEKEGGRERRMKERGKAGLDQLNDFTVVG